MKSQILLIVLSAIGVALGSFSCAPLEQSKVSAATVPPRISPAVALRRIKGGNKRFTSDQLQHPYDSNWKRSDLTAGQYPFVIVLGCSDSRVPPELVFDQGLGDVFVVRVAGNVLNKENVGSIEYAVANLGTPLIVVLGHEHCGAVKAAKQTIAAKGKAPGQIHSLVEAIRPAVEATVGQDAEATCQANVRHVVETLKESKPIIYKLIDSGKVAVVGAYYDLPSGKVEFLK